MNKVKEYIRKYNKLHIIQAAPMPINELRYSIYDPKTGKTHQNITEKTK